MRHSALLFFGLSLAALAACSGEGAGPPVTTSVQRSANRIAGNDGDHSQLLYLARWGGHEKRGGQGEILVYRGGGYKGPFRKFWQGLDAPFALAVDSHRNLYAANALNGTITVYPPGQDVPAATLTGTVAPVNVAVGLDGTVYVSNVGDIQYPPEGNGSVLEYRKGATKPSKTLVAFEKEGTHPEGIALDSSDNLYVAVDKPAHGSDPRGEVLEFPSGKSTHRDLGIRVGYAEGLTIDNGGDILLVDANDHCTDTFPPGQTQPSKKNCGSQEPAYVALNRANTLLFVTNGFYAHVDIYDYPGGQFRERITRIPGYGFVTGVAVSPAD